MLTAQTQPYNRLEKALVEYELAREQGKALERGEFLARYPELADELRPLFDAVPQIEQFACPLREALAGKPPLAVPAPDGYEVLELIAIGGMGVVYKARQTGTEQLVALKLLRPDWLAGLDEPTRRQALEPGEGPHPGHHPGPQSQLAPPGGDAPPADRHGGE